MFRRGLLQRGTAVLAFGLAGLLPACRLVEPTLADRMERPAPRSAIDIVTAIEPRTEPRVEAPDPIPSVGGEAPAASRVRIGDDTRVSFEFRGEPLAVALHHIAEFAGVNMYLDAGLDRPVDASFPEVTVNGALWTLLERNGLSLMEDPPGIYWVTVTDGSQPSIGRFRLRSVGAADVEEDLRAVVSAEARIVVNAAQNFVQVFGSQSDVDAVTAYLEGVDRLKRQVLIEARIVEVTLDEDFQLGTSISWDNIGIGDGNAASLLQAFTTADDSFSLEFQDDDGDFNAIVQALSAYAGVEVVSSPKVVAVNNSEAMIEVIREVPYVRATTETDVATGGTGSSTVEEIDYKEAGVRMTVTPVIQEGGVVELSVTQELSEVSGFFLETPIIDSRKLTTVMQVRDENTLVIGGLMQDRLSQTDRGVPVLMHVPLIGRLFRSDEDVTEKRELLVFLTPRIVDLSDTNRVTESYREIYEERRRELGQDATHGNRGDGR